MNFSKYLTKELAEKTATGLPNVIPDKFIPNVTWMGKNIIDPIMEHFKFPTMDWIIILYRSPKVNSLAGGDPASYHLEAAAVDMKPSKLGKVFTNSQLFYFIANNLKFDKLIWEFGNGIDPQWVHAQGKPAGNRNLFVLAYKDSNKETVYTRFSTLTEFQAFKKQIYG